MNKNEDEIELYYIYIVLGRLRSLVPTTIDRLSINQSIFPKRFVYKLMNDRLKESVGLAAKLATVLFRRLLSSEFEQQQNQHQRNGQQLVDTVGRQRAESGGKAGAWCPELEEYFYRTLCNVHDFLMNLSWHEPILDASPPTKSDDAYIKSKLPHLRELIKFRALLMDSNATKIVTMKESPGVKGASIVDKASKSPKGIRSSLTRRSPNSPGPRRRVRFNVSGGAIKSLTQDSARNKKYIKDSHSILALDMTLFALDAFVKELRIQLLEWSSVSTASMKESMQLIRTSRRKLRVNRLILMAKDRELSNSVHASILNNLAELENIYLLDYLLTTICTQDDERLLRVFKKPHVRSFVNEYLRPNEKEILNLLVIQTLEIITELAIFEINMPPAELTGNRRSQLKAGIRSNQENYLNLITSWLNLGTILFGSQAPLESAGKKTAPTNQQVRGKGADTGFDFKSSSRILNQMDNLHELMRHILGDLIEQLNSKRHVEYCLHLLHRRIGQCFELIGQQLEPQLSSVRRALIAQEKQSLKNDTEDMQQHLHTGNVDRVALKIRYLKLIHISSSMDNLIKELSRVASVDVTADAMLSSDKLSRLIDESTKQMESI